MGERVGTLTAEQVETALDGESRQYLAGTLALPQALAHLEDTELEVGVSDYKVATADLPHIHPRAREYQYVLSGRAHFRDLDTDTVLEFQAGDFYVVDRGVPHAQKNTAGTRILFWKSPAGNDKQLVPVTPALQAWLDDLDF